MDNLNGKTIKSYTISKLKITITFTDGSTFWIEPTNVHTTLECGMNIAVKVENLPPCDVKGRTCEGCEFKPCPLE